MPIKERISGENREKGAIHHVHLGGEINKGVWKDQVHIQRITMDLILDINLELNYRTRKDTTSMQH